MSTYRFTFSRQELAAMLADELLGRLSPFDPSATHLVSNPSSGTFLSAPRRTGKSTFLKKDLVPALQERKAAVIYVDLWVNKERNPADLINEALQESLLAYKGILERTAMSAGLSKLTIAGAFSFDIAKAGTTEGATLARALGELAEKAEGKRVILIIDEAQHALSTSQGVNSLYALKAARDALNVNEDDPRLILLCTGSHRSKLANLLTTKDHPFFGSRVRDFPTMGKEFTDAMTGHYNAMMIEQFRFTQEAMYDAFRILSNRPEEMIAAITDAYTDAPTSEGADINRLLLERAREARSGDLHQLQIQFDSLTPLQQAMLLKLIRDGDRFSPYAADALAEYGKSAGTGVTVGQAQQALETLVARSIVWNPRRGGYYLDDPLWPEWNHSRTVS